MILLDTNVVSEVMRMDGSPAVHRWLKFQPTDTLHLAATSLAELLSGIEALPESRRKAAMTDRLRNATKRFLAGRILAFDKDAAEAYSLLVASSRRRGYAIAWADGQIAAIARNHGLTVATRDVSPFLAAELPVINPWEAGAAPS